MHLLAYIHTRHPVATTLTGIFGGMFSWVMQYVEPVTKLISLIGAAAGAGVAVLSLVIKIQAWRARRRLPNPPPYIDEDDDIPFV